MSNKTMGLEGGDSILMRHADKGGWKIDLAELKEKVGAGADYNLIVGILEREFPEMLKDGKTPLKLDGLLRALKIGEKVFDKLPDESVLVVIDSGKDRAVLTGTLADAKIAQLESVSAKTDHPKKVDMLRVDADELKKLLADSSPDTWGPYAKMMEDEKITEEEAIFRWLMDMNNPGSDVDPAVAPKEAGERYRALIRLMHGEKGVTSEKIPVVLLGVGHSGSLGQIRHEHGQMNSAEDAPGFCEMHKFDMNGALVDREKVEI